MHNINRNLFSKYIPDLVHFSKYKLRDFERNDGINARVLYKLEQTRVDQRRRLTE